MSIVVESFLSTILENVLEKVGALLLKEVRLAWEFKRDLRRLGDNLSAIKAVLLDAEEQQARAQAHELKLWLERLKKFCYKAEDVFDELEYEGLRKQVVQQYGSTKTKVCRFFSSSNSLVFRLKIGHKIKELRESLDDIVAQKSKFHLVEPVRPVMEHRARETTDSFVRMSKVVGRDVDKEKITELLLRDGSLGVIPIVGIGGVGKTMLAKMLYNDEAIDEHFELKMWVCVSEDGFDKKKIMVKMMNFFTKQKLSDYEPELMQTFIREKLNSKRFLLVLDDVWSDNRSEWVELIDLLEEGGSGSKIIVTTRNNNVAKTVYTTPPYNLQPLPDEDCLSLLKKLAFREGEEERYPNLVEIGNDIVRKCRGLPLAIRTLGTLLYAKRDEREWVSIRDNEIWKLEQSKGDILPILKLSYDKLPSHLKSCFAICSFFPKDFEFNSLRLTQFWMGHGLLQSPDGNEELEDIGLRYEKELCSRSFFQDIEDLGFYWRFKMHDLMHDLAMSVAHNECLMVKRCNEVISEGTRYLSFLDVKDFLYVTLPNSVRTIFFLPPYGEESPAVLESLVDKCISTCRHLRVLIVRDLLPSSIGDLKHLRHLQLHSKEIIKKLPDSLWKLHNLLTLDISGCAQLEELPRDIRKLIKLRFLRFTTEQKRLPKDGLSNLKSLRSLIVVRCTQLEVLFEGDEPDTTFLRLLFIQSCWSLISLGLSLKCLAALETLIILYCARLNLMEEDDIGDIEFRLRYLSLVGLPQLMTLPQWLQRSSKTLQHIRIVSCENLSSLPEWLSNFKSLRKFEVINCPKLLTLPEGMRHLTVLELLVIKDCPALAERCQRSTGEDWHKIYHIPNIKII